MSDIDCSSVFIVDFGQVNVGWVGLFVSIIPNVLQVLLFIKFARVKINRIREISICVLFCLHYQYLY